MLDWPSQLQSSMARLYIRAEAVEHGSTLQKPTRPSMARRYIRAEAVEHDSTLQKPKRPNMARRYTGGVRGPNMITAMPARHRAAPNRSQRLGRMPSTSHSQNSAVPM